MCPQVSHVFHVDRAFNARASQEDVFAEVSQFVQSALDGYNVSLFAYGQVSISCSLARSLSLSLSLT